MKSDIDISYDCKMLNINEISRKLGINDKYVENYGKYKAKINIDLMKNLKDEKDGKLILVTSINPTPYGEGKTTMSIGINDALNYLGKKSIAALREPSLGPVFGIKGGATGGGYSQVVPMEDINLHFTGDLHAITACNNLLCSAIDNHIYQGNALKIKEVLFKRCLDINDRALRNIRVGLNSSFERNDHFVITVASEIMAILCLSKDLEDLKTRLNNILIAYDENDKPIFVNDLGCASAMTILLKDAINPNLVQTLENNPVIIHGGPFANIAHGCSSIIGTKLALKLADYVVTEAGFGSDLGAEKFFDIKCRVADLFPSAVVINCTVRSLKYNGGCLKEELSIENLNCLEQGIGNLGIHIDNVKKYTNNIIVCINKFANDSAKEIEYIKNYCNDKEVLVEECSSFANGSKGAVDLARKIMKICDQEKDFNYLYDTSDEIKNKITIISKEIYRAKSVTYSEEALANIKKIEKMGMNYLPVCIAKTQYSITDDPKKLGSPINSIVYVNDVSLSRGAGFIVVYMGSIMTMPGLSKNPSMFNMQIDNNKHITGLF